MKFTELNDLKMEKHEQVMFSTLHNLFQLDLVSEMSRDVGVVIQPVVKTFMLGKPSVKGCDKEKKNVEYKMK